MPPVVTLTVLFSLPFLRFSSLVEKVITLENVSLVDFLGADNQNIRRISASFPGRKIVSRGNEIKIQRPTEVMARANVIFSPLLEHSHRDGGSPDRDVCQ